MAKSGLPIRVDKDFYRLLLQIKSENLKNGKNPTIKQITRKMSKILNMRDLIF